MMRPGALLALVALAGCAVGPRYHASAPVTAAAGPFRSGLAVDPAGDLPTHWWSLYNDPQLDALVEEALVHNSDLRVAAANLERARAVLSEQRAQLLPTTQLTSSFARSRGGAFTSGFSSSTTTGASSGTTGTGGGTGTTGTGTATGTTGMGTGTAGGGTSSGGSGANGASGVTSAVSTAGTPIDIVHGAFSLAYEVDLFGRVRRSIEAARGDYEATRATGEATRVTVAAATTQAYFDACLLGARATVAQRSLAIVQAALDGVKRQVALGVGSPYDITRQGVIVEQTRAIGNQVVGLRAQALYDLTRLLGRPATQVPPAALACRTAPKLARPIPIGDGAAMIARRPDIRSAERTLAADTARIGVSVAELFPTISLGGSISVAGTGLKSAFSRAGTSYSFGPFFSWFFPNIAAARARVREANAQARASLASFDGTVLTALNEVQDALAGYDSEIRRNESLSAAVADSQRAYALAQVRVRLGSISQLELIDVENDLINTQLALAQSDGTLGDDQVTLFRTLGGGWQDAPAIDPAPRAVALGARP